ncbi:two component transcriptional regulator, LuxR family [Trichlorobacter thiogenes]|uniref:Two component transcriptional regulator, LuxR family n=1 Tax=Trichlorobacter thiogenes TaxID=115783 RepID=A0A1T4QEJ5_9BACT|nr:response regulator transcription factor [Trichlorobacter thiogenes]SKA02230.1 two component transcriptional regulator, LuxR family [Trichlorobacter thiogenes]
MPLIQLVIADDHAIFRQGLRSLIAMADDCEIVGECSRGDEALVLIRKLRPTLAILDISMPGLDGLSTVAALRREGDATPVVILTTHDDPLMLERARVSGANGYVNKEFAFEQLLQTIRNVADGSVLLDAAEQSAPLHEGHFLTDRELEVIRLVACGMSSRLIGESLGISNKTVDNHRTNIMNKLRIHTTAELVRYAIKVGLG